MKTRQIDFGVVCALGLLSLPFCMILHPHSLRNIQTKCAQKCFLPFCFCNSEGFIVAVKCRIRFRCLLSFASFFFSFMPSFRRVYEFSFITYTHVETVSTLYGSVSRVSVLCYNNSTSNVAAVAVAATAKKACATRGERIAWL